MRASSTSSTPHGQNVGSPVAPTTRSSRAAIFAVQIMAFCVHSACFANAGREESVYGGRRHVAPHSCVSPQHAQQQSGAGPPGSTWGLLPCHPKPCSTPAGSLGRLQSSGASVPSRPPWAAPARGRNSGSLRRQFAKNIQAAVSVLRFAMAACHFICSGEKCAAF